jgi:hypothetical protein
MSYMIFMYLELGWDLVVEVELYIFWFDEDDDSNYALIRVESGVSLRVILISLAFFWLHPSLVLYN